MTTPMNDLTEVKVATLPFCDIHKYYGDGTEVLAAYDGRTVSGQWGYMCEEHFPEWGVGLGLGKGQRLILEGSED